MPIRWTPEKELRMLLIAITKADLKPTSQTWACVATHLGEGLTANAVYFKYYKLRKESEKLFGEGKAPSATKIKKRAVIEGRIQKASKSARVKPGLLAGFDDGTPYTDSGEEDNGSRVKGSMEYNNSMEPVRSISLSSAPTTPDVMAKQEPKQECVD